LYSNDTVANLGSFLPAAINDNNVMAGGPQLTPAGTVQNLNTLIQPDPAIRSDPRAIAESVWRTARISEPWFAPPGPAGR
jgi:hypothetical protein